MRFRYGALQYDRRGAHALLVGLFTACAVKTASAQTPGADERIRVWTPDSGVTATLASPIARRSRDTVDLVFYALPNGNSTAETMGRAQFDSTSWRFDIQHIAAQTRAARAGGLPDLVVVYLAAAGKSWPAWRQARGYAEANLRIRGLLERLRDSVSAELNTRNGRAPVLRVTLSGHSGGGSLMFGLIESGDRLPSWLDRLAFLDANYNFDPRHGPVFDAWLAGSERRRLMVLAYDDRDIRVNGRKVVSDSGGTWRATERMQRWFDRRGGSAALTRDSAGAFIRWRSANAQVELLAHPNPDNRILHTELVGEMNGFLYVVLADRVAATTALPFPAAPRRYVRFVQD